MLWRQLFSKKSDNPTDHIEQDYSAPLGCVLESRVLFDGAIAATATQAETGNSSDATASSHPTQTANHSAEAASENNTSSNQNSATHDITTDVVVQAVAGEITRKEAVFIDTAVTDYQTLIGNVPAGVDVFLLDSSKDGLSQLATWAETHKGYDAIHILSHGSEGQVRLGNLTLDSATAVERSADLAKFGTALTQDGDLLLYGCDIAQDTGKSFVSLLAQLTQADIAASDDLTGATAKGGDWQLETTVGKIETTNAALGAIAQEYNSLLASPTYGTNDFSQFSGTTPFVNVQPGLQTYDDPNNGFTYVANSTGSVTIQTVSLSGNQVLNTIVTPGGNLNYFGFKSTDGSEFKLSSIDLRGLGNYASTFTITGYKDGSAVAGTTQTITLTTTFQTVTLSNAFQNIDEVRLTTAATGNGTVTWDNIVTAPLAASTDNVPSVTATGANPTYTENGTAVGLFTGVSVDTQDTGQTFTSAAFTVSNVAGSTEYLTLHGINVALSNGNSVSLGSGFGTASVSLSGSIATVSITGATLSNSDMGSLLSGMAYGNSSDNPGNATRTVTLTQLTDSGTSNNTVAPNISSAITVVPVNDAPTDITLSATTFAQSLGSNGTVATLTATDVDSSVFTYSLVSGSGSTDNALFTISGNTLKAVNATGMAAGTYSVRLQVSDGAATYDKVVSLVVVDDIAPTFDQSPSVSNATVGGFNLSTSINEAGTIYYVIVADGASAPSVSQVISGQNASGATAIGSGSQVVSSAPYTTSFSVTGLNGATSYDVYIVAKDSANNQILSATKVDVTTSSNSAPVFSNLNGGATFTEKGSAVVIDSNVAVVDTELDALSGGLGNYSGASLTLARNGGANSQDNFGNSGLLGVLAAGQSFTYNGTTVGNVTTNSSGTLALTFNGNATSAIVNAVLQSLTYANSSDNPPASVTLNWVFNDGTINSSGSNQAIVSITPVNDAPTISNISVSKTFNEDSAQTFSASDFGFSDVDSGDTLQAVTIVTAPTAGELFIDANGDGVRGVGDTLLVDGATVSAANISKLTFLPAENANGTGYATFTWTVSDGTASSTDIGTMSLNVTAVNDAPVISDTSISKTFNEDTAQTFTASDFGFSDVDSGNTLQSITLITSPTAGELFIDANGDGVRGVGDTLLGNGSVVSAADIDKLTFRPEANANGAGYATFTWTVSDGTDSSANTGTMTLNVTAVNDAPTLNNSATATLTGTNENTTSAATAVTLLLSQAGYGDVDSGAQIGLAITSSVGRGGWQYSTDSGANWFNLGSVSASSALLLNSSAQLRYVPDSANGETATLSFRAWDQTSGTATAGSSKGLADTATTGGSSAFSTNSAQASLVVTSVNDAPTVVSAISSQSATKDAAFSFTVPAGTFVDVDNGDTLTLNATQADGSELPSWLSFNPATGTFSGTPDNGDIGSLSIRVIATDGSNTSASTTFGLTVNNSNLPPVVSLPVVDQTIVQDGSLNFSVPAGTFTDPDVGDTLTLSATLADGSTLPSWITFNPATGTFSGTPGNADVGSLSIRVTATDGSNATVHTDFSLTITNVNDAPVVATPIPAQNITQNDSMSFTVPSGTFTDPDVGDTLTLSATLADGSPLPSWITFNPATGTFSGTPGNADVGSLSIRVTATDGSNASVYTDFSLTVTNVNDAPVVATPIPAQSVVQDSGFNFIVPAGTFTDPDGDTLTLSATLADGSPLPSWITFNPATGTFSGTPGNGDVGSLSIRVTATDGSNASVYTDFSLTVTNVNDAPVVATPIPAQSVAQDGSLNFSVPAGTFTEPDVGDTLTLSATLADGSPLPSWITFNPATGTFSGTPDNGDVGSLSIRVTATDGSNASVYTDFSLTVTNVNDAPVVATPIPAQSVVQDSGFNFIVPAGTFTDPDGDTLTLNATLADGSTLPSWITFNPATGTFSGTPGNADVGSLSIRVTATDGSNASVYTDFSLTVTNVNDAPVVATPIPAQSVAQDGSLNFSVPAGTFTDADVGDTLTLSATLADGSPLPSWITFNPATGTFSGTPDNADVGSLSIRVTATDGSNASVYTDFSLTVTNVNDAPVVATPIPAQSVAQDGSLNFSVPAGTFTDPDVGDTLTLSATLTNGSPLPGWITFNSATGTFSGTPGNADVGSLSIRVTATDGSNASVHTDFSLTVTNVNDAPVVATPIPAQSVAQDGSLNFNVPAGTFTDPDVGDTLTLSATLADGSPLPGWITFNSATGTFSGTPDNGDVGSLSIRVTATDGSNATVYTDFSLTVTNVNDTPVVATPIPAQSVAQDGSLNFSVPAGTFTDADVGDTLTLSATLADGSPLPSWIIFNPATGTFSGTPGNADVGSLSIRVTATDGSNATVHTDFSLTVTNVNDAPVVATPIPAQSVVQDSGLNFTVPAGTFSDADVGDTLTLSATLADGSPLPSWITFNPATGTFSGTPGNGDVGSLSIRVTATDGSNTSISTSFGLTVTNVNDAPVVGTSIPAQSVAQDSGFNFTVPAGTFSDADVGDTLTLSATLADGSPLPSWITFNPATGTFSGTPGNADVGSLSIRVTATDGSNTSISTSFGLTVTNVNDAPVVGTSIPAQSVAQDSGLNFTVPAGTFSDADVGDTLTLSATLADGSPLPSWITFNPATGTFSGTPGNGDVGSLSIRVTATDGSNTSISTSFGLTVTNVNDAPVVGTSIPAQSVAQDSGFNFTVPAGTFSDADGDTLTLSATLADGSPLPSWLRFDPAIGTFSGTPSNSDVGTLVIRVTATDGSNTSISTSFGLTVTNVNDAPVVGTSIPTQSVAQDSGLNFTVPAGTFTDPDVGDTLTLSATLADGSPLPSWLSFDPAIGTFSGTPDNGDVGTLVIRVTATDGSNTSISTSFGLTVTNVNDAPVVGTSIPAQSVAQDSGFNFTVPAGTFSDADGDTLTLSATLADGSPLPSWITFNPATGTFSGTPGNGDVSTLVIRVTATDGSNTSISTSFGLTVTRSIVGGDPQFKANDGIGRTPSASDTRQLSTQDAAIAEPTLGGLITNPSLGGLTVGNDGAPKSVMSAIFATGRQNTEGGTLPTSQVAGTFGRGVTSGIGVNFDSTLGSFPSFSKDPALGGTSSLASAFSGIYLPSLTPMEVFSGGSWKDIPLDRASSAMNSTDDSTGRSVAFTPSLHQQLQQIGDSELQRLAVIEQALQESSQQQG